MGWNTPLLPEKIQKFNNHPVIPVFRVVGELSFYCYNEKHIIFFLQSLVLFIAFIHISYFVVINITKVFYGKYKLFTGNLNVKNSPLNHFASYSGKLLYSLKVGCYIGYSGLGIATTSVVADTLL